MPCKCCGASQVQGKIKPSESLKPSDPDFCCLLCTHGATKTKEIKALKKSWPEKSPQAHGPVCCISCTGVGETRTKEFKPLDTLAPEKSPQAHGQNICCISCTGGGERRTKELKPLETLAPEKSPQAHGQNICCISCTGGDTRTKEIKPLKTMMPKKCQQAHDLNICCTLCTDGETRTKGIKPLAPKKCQQGQDKNELKKKLEECILKFDSNSPDTIAALTSLKNYINEKTNRQKCYPRTEWPHCPPEQIGDPYPVPHPYIPGITLYAKPMFRRRSAKVTLDGRMAEPFRPRQYYHEELPLKVPPWVLPRYKSQELRGGLLLQGCDCWKKNGLQDDCLRWDCGGRPECLTRPLPVCPPSMAPPLCGVRKPNLYHGKPPICKVETPPPPFPTLLQEMQSISLKDIPSAPSAPCPLHEFN